MFLIQARVAQENLPVARTYCTISTGFNLAYWLAAFRAKPGPD